MSHIEAAIRLLWLPADTVTLVIATLLLYGLLYVVVTACAAVFVACAARVKLL